MCGLFGVTFYGETIRDVAGLVEELAIASTARGIQATGISWVTEDEKMAFRKKAESAVDFKAYGDIPKKVRAVLGHTRRTTKGNEKFNYNNHPFFGQVGKTKFAFAHNGVLDNDIVLKRTMKLPETKIKTDSYVAVQLLEQHDKFNIDALKDMGETVEGMFTFTLLDNRNNIYVVKNDSPFVIAHFKSLEMYVWASTERILMESLVAFPETRDIVMNSFRKGDASNIEIIEPSPGEILRINQKGAIDWYSFNPRDRRKSYANDRWYRVANANGDSELTTPSFQGWGDIWDAEETDEDGEYNQALIAQARSMGITEWEIEMLYDAGYEQSDIEEGLFDYSIFEMVSDAKMDFGYEMDDEDFEEVGIRYTDENIKDLPFVITKETTKEGVKN